MPYLDQYNKYISQIEESLEFYFPNVPIAQARLFDSAHYSLFAGGKRIRPIILLEFCRICGGHVMKAMPFACALEMIHTYSLIHDDLPCMDNDDMRRGRPTNHKIFGDATAILAGDALLTAAFEVMLDPENVGSLDPNAVIKAAHSIAWAAGAFGMVGGQTLDIDTEGNILPVDAVTAIHNLKTGAMFSAAAEAGCILAGADPDQTATALAFAQSIGLSFQIRDDILNASGDSEKMGKDTGTDVLNEKLTFVQIMGVEECSRLVTNLTDTAKERISVFPDSGFLMWMADRLAVREG